MSEERDQAQLESGEELSPVEYAYVQSALTRAFKMMSEKQTRMAQMLADRAVQVLVRVNGKADANGQERPSEEEVTKMLLHEASEYAARTAEMNVQVAGQVADDILKKALDAPSKPSITIAATLCNVACVFSVCRRMSEASRCMRLSLNMLDILQADPAHPQARDLLPGFIHNLAEFLMDEDRYQEAEPLVERLRLVNPAFLSIRRFDEWKQKNDEAYRRRELQLEAAIRRFETEDLPDQTPRRHLN